MKKMISSIAAVFLLAACSSSNNSAEAQPADNATVMTDAQSIGFNGNVKYADAPIYMLGMSRIGFDTDGYINELGWAVENGSAKDLKNDDRGRLESFTMVVDECDEEIEYPTSTPRDSEGRISSILFQDINYTYEYDNSGRVASVTYQPNYDAEGGIVYRMEYTPKGDVAKVTRSYPDGSVDTHNFDYNSGKDSNGNWTKRVERLTQNGEDWEPRTEERSIIYY